MGWYSQHRDKGVSDREWFQREFGERYEIVESASHQRRVFYAAVRNKDTGEVFAFVALMQWTRDWCNFTYKSMDETMGPNEDECPARILSLLTPTDAQYAIEWRERCRANLARNAAVPKVKPGDTVRFERPMEFGDGAELDTFVFEKGSVFRRAGGYSRYRITNWRKRSFEIVERAA